MFNRTVVKQDILFSTNLIHFFDGKSVLQRIGKKLTESYRQLNNNIDHNTFVIPGSNGQWKTKKDDPDYSASEFIPKLLSGGKSMTLYEIMREIDDYTEFSTFFKHFQTKHSKKNIDNKLLYAVLMSLGTNIGHNDMDKATNSKHITTKKLRDTEKLWLSESNLEKANAAIVNFIQNLPLPTIYNDHNDLLHTSSDGKKLVVAVDSLLANYSYKYYGKEQGVTVNSFVDTSQSFFHVNVLTSSDREAAYMMDGIVKTKANHFNERNDDIDDQLFGNPKHSTDTHGYTDAIFAGLHFLDVSFAPRLTDLPNRALFAYDSKSLLKNSNYKVGPRQQINRKLILENWDDILRLMATIKSGKQSASLIFRRLAASKKASNVYKAMKGLGQLIKSNFIANYLQDEELRRSIQKQLNRAELGQKFSSALFFGRKGQLVVGSEESIQKTMLCKTILKNIVILWNYLFLSDHIISLRDDNDTDHILDSISEGSVISWRHINMHGIYDFDHKPIKSFKASIKQIKNLKVK
jgi:TnpA family transposase